MRLSLPLHRGQREVIEAARSNRYVTLVAGRRWGKGEVAAARLVMGAATTEGHYAYIAPTYKMARRIEWMKTLRWARLFSQQSGLKYAVNRSDLLVTFPATGGMVGHYGADNPDSLRGVDRGFAGVVLDEFDMFPREGGDVLPYLWEAVIRPALADSRGWAQIQGTPDGFAGLYEAYKRGGQVPGWTSLHFRSLDNPLLDKEEIEEARRTTDPRLFRQEWEASFETPAGRVYDTFDRAHNVRPCPFDPALQVYVGMDFNVDPMSAVLVQRHGREWWVFETVELRNSNTRALGDHLHRRLAELYKGPPVIPPRLWVDPSGVARQHALGQSDVIILRGLGFDVHWRTLRTESDKYNSVRAQVLNAAGERRLFIDPSCRRLVERMEQLGYDDEDDHLTDALGYLMYGEVPASRSGGD
ncbi:MAG: terminase large subunit domain-containing protein [Thermodesulfobacteriota bacterium]